MVAEAYQAAKGGMGEGAKESTEEGKGSSGEYEWVNEPIYGTAYRQRMLSDDEIDRWRQRWEQLVTDGKFKVKSLATCVDTMVL